MSHDTNEEKKCFCSGETDAYTHHIDGKCIKDDVLIAPSEVSTWEERFDDVMPNILHEFQRRFNEKDILFNDLPPLERRALKYLFVEKIKELVKEEMKSIREEAKRDEQERINKAIVNHFNNTEAFYGNPRKEKMIYYDDALEIINLISDNKN